MASYTQINEIIGGVVQDVHPSKVTQNQIIEAVNVRMSESGGGDALAIRTVMQDRRIVSVANEDPLDAGIVFKFSMATNAVFEFIDESPRPAVVYFGVDSLDNWAIFILNPVTEKIHKIYDDKYAPVRDRQGKLAIGNTLDLVQVRFANSVYAYFIDGINPIRHIELRVKANSYDNYTAPNSSMYIPNEQDCLLVQRVYPVLKPEIAPAFPANGSFQCGKYRLVYRLYNTTTKAYSTWSIASEPLNILPSYSTGLGVNEVNGGYPGEQSNMAIDLSFYGSHFHWQMFDSLEVALIKDFGNAGIVVDTVLPSKAYYDAAVSSSSILLTGGEAYIRRSAEYAIDLDAGIDSAFTLEVVENRLWLMGIKYFDFEGGAVTGVSAKSKIIELFATAADPELYVDTVDGGALDAVPPGSYSPYSEVDTRYYFREEVYRFGVSWVDKFGRWSLPKPIDFSSLPKYDPLNHASTWDDNWASAGVDWKFPSRECEEASITGNGVGLRGLALELSDVGGHPDWAFGMSIMRRKRIPNILGQTPVLNGATITAGAFNVFAHSLAWASTDKNPQYWSSNRFHDADGSLDTIEPKVMAMGHTKNITPMIYPMDATTPDSILVWDRQYSRSVVFGTFNDIDANRERHYAFGVFLYPMEGLYQSAEGDLIQRGSIIKPIDVVILKSFNAYRDATLFPGFNAYGGSPTDAEKGNMFKDGAQAEYIWLFRPSGPSSYYYANRTLPKTLFSGPDAVNPGIPIWNGYFDVKIEDVKRVQFGPGKYDIQSIGNSPKNRHITTLHGLYDLANAQAQLLDPAIWDTSTAYPYTDVQNCPSVFAIIDSPIYDPNALLWEYLAGGFDYYTPAFGAYTPQPSSRGIRESTTVTSYADRIDPAFTAEIDDNYLIEPGYGVAVVIANIEAGLDDNRYGDSSTDDSLYYHTNAYTPITGADIAGNTLFDFLVLAGDCYVTRSKIAVRQNAPRKYRTDLIPPSGGATDYRYGIPIGSSTDISQVGRVSTYTQFVEILDLWVESTINGCLTTFGEGKYPHGIEDAPSANTSIDAAPYTSYSYPEEGTIYSFSPLYIGADAYGGSADIYPVQGFSEITKGPTFIPSRIHWSNVSIENNMLQLGYDRWGPFDRYDMPATGGLGVKMIKDTANTVLVLQEDSVFRVYTGAMQTIGANGESIVVVSDQVISKTSFVSDNRVVGGIAGCSSPQHVVYTDDAVIFLDAKRGNIWKVENGFSNISKETINSFLQENIGDIEGFKMYYAKDSDYVYIVLDNPQTIKTYYNRRQAFSGDIVIPAQPNTILFAGNGGKELIAAGGTISVMDAYDDLQPVGFLDNHFFPRASYESYYTYVLNGNTTHAHKRKVLRAIVAKGWGFPFKAVAKSFTGTDEPLAESEAQFARNRFGDYIANRFSDTLSLGKVRGAYALITVYLQHPDKPSDIPNGQSGVGSDDRVLISSSETHYRIQDRR